MNPILSQLAVRNGNSAGAGEESLMALGEALSSLRIAVSKLQTLKDSETNQYFRSFEVNFPRDGIDFYKATRLYEINLVKQALRVTKGHQAKAAKLLKMRTSTLNSFIKRHNINY